MDLLDAHGYSMDRFDRLVRRIGDRWDAPTPCTEWSVRDLLNHLVSEQLWAPWLLDGATLDDVGDRFDGNVLGIDPVTAWADSSAAARAAFRKPGALDGDVYVSVGMIDAVEYGWQMTTDLAVHGWDLAMAIGEPQPITDELANELIARFEPYVDALQGHGIFEPPVRVGDDAAPADRLVALLGRDPAWQRS
ncbi:TIGR03086 family metal-binding protein [Haloechinothrix halophila]|uniref:TIGR03086 family metal-binding protein n=1 Tax=Haloechinothrix halophila TaxID=1069073 RepID=UPI000421D9D5|nr:TIGR03086 family metal-binding protein [Haloechinothrix halophila]